MRYSRQREALLQLLRSTTSHPDAEWLYEGLRKENPRISLGTVYRNLRQLADAGEIIEIASGTVSHFDGDISLGAGESAILIKESSAANKKKLTKMIFLWQILLKHFRFILRLEFLKNGQF